MIVSDPIPRSPEAMLSAALLAANAGVRDLLVIGGVLGAVSGIGAMYELQPLLFFFPLGWLLFSASRIFPVLSSPRRDTLAFVLGLAYEKRRALSFRFTVRKCVELAILCMVAGAAFCLTRLVLYKNPALSEGLLGAEVMLGETAVLYAALLAAIKLPVIRPSRRDERPLFSFALPRFPIVKRSGSFFIRMADSVSRFFTGDSRIIAKRIVLYLLRSDVAGLVFFSSASFVITLLVTLFFRDSQGFVSGLILLVGPVVVLFEMTPAMSESALRLSLCHYYFFREKTVSTVYFIFASAATLPFILMYAVKMAFLDGPVHAPGLFRIAAFFLSCAATGLSFSQLWISAASPTIMGSGIALALLTSLVGLAVPYYGPLLPVFALAVLWFIGRK